MRHKVLREALDLVGRTPFDSPQWCGRFVLLVLQNAGLVQDWKMLEDGTGAMVCSRLKLTRSPMVGDIAKFSVHYGIFVGFTYGKEHASLNRLINKKDDIVSVDGGSFKDLVYMSRRPIHPKTEFYSIEGILQ